MYRVKHFSLKKKKMISLSALYGGWYWASTNIWIIIKMFVNIIHREKGFTWFFFYVDKIISPWRKGFTCRKIFHVEKCFLCGENFVMWRKLLTGREKCFYTEKMLFYVEKMFFLCGQNVSLFSMQRNFFVWRNIFTCGIFFICVENALFADKLFSHTENIFEWNFFLPGENVFFYVEKCVTWRKCVLHEENIL